MSRERLIPEHDVQIRRTQVGANKHAQNRLGDTPNAALRVSAAMLLKPRLFIKLARSIFPLPIARKPVCVCGPRLEVQEEATGSQHHARS